MEREGRPRGVGQATAQDPQPRAVGKATLTEALGFGTSAATPQGLGVGTGGVPRLNLYPSGIGEGNPGGEIHAFREQISTASGPAAEAAAGPGGPAVAHVNSPTKPTAENPQ